MLITSGALDAIYRGFSLAFKGAFDGAETQWQKIATLAPSSTRSNTYAWLTQAPRMREWVGDRVLKSLSAYAYVIENRKFESTIEVGRTDIEDDQIGMFGGLVSDMGRAAAEFPDELLFALLAQGFGLPCYDGQNFFDDEHPSGADGATLTRNYQDGGGEAWYLLETSRALKPLIYQERTKPEFAAITKPDDERVFMRDEYVYGTRLRANAGFGLWQLPYASKAPLTAAKLCRPAHGDDGPARRRGPPPWGQAYHLGRATHAGGAGSHALEFCDHRGEHQSVGRFGGAHRLPVAGGLTPPWPT